MEYGRNQPASGLLPKMYPTVLCFQVTYDQTTSAQQPCTLCIRR